MSEYPGLFPLLALRSTVLITLLGSLCTVLLGVMFTYMARAGAWHLGFVAAPREDRWHRKPTAMLGGIGIYTAFAVAYLVFAPQLVNAYPIFIVSTLLFALGVIDDIVYIKPYTKLIAQVIAAAAVVSFGLHLPWTHSKTINDLLTIFWLVGITNAINLLDNMDGLAGGVSLIACVFLIITFLLNGQAAEAVLPALLGGALLGFLVYNFSPASVFMGDCGSMSLGFMLGGLALLSDYGRMRNLASVLLTPMLIMAIPIFDTCVVTVTRKLSGRPVSQGARDHTSHRLVALGMSERRAVLYLYGCAVFSGLLALLVRWLNAEVILLLVPSFALMVLFFGFYLGKVNIMEAEQPPLGSTLVSTLVDFAYKRRVFEVLLDLVVVVLAYYGAYLLRYDGQMPGEQMAIFTKTLLPVVVIEMLCFLVWGVYRGLWHYAGVHDLVVIAKAVLIGTLTSAFVVLAMYGFRGPSRAVLVLNLVLLLVAVSVGRLSFRLLQALLVDRAKVHPDATPVVIYGAGDGGLLLLHELLGNSHHPYAPVGFIDDDNRKVGQRIDGYPIFDICKLPGLIRTHGISEVLVSSWKVPESKVDAVRDLGMGIKRMSISLE